MINANEARRQMKKDIAVDICKKRTEKNIRDAIANGRNRTCLSNTYCYLKEDGTAGTVYDRYVDCTHEIKEWLRSLGYRIEPTGYIGGVWQRTEDIVW